MATSSFIFSIIVLAIFFALLLTLHLTVLRLISFRNKRFKKQFLDSNWRTAVPVLFYTVTILNGVFWYVFPQVVIQWVGFFNVDSSSIFEECGFLCLL